jgi:hypothetical protein
MSGRCLGASQRQRLQIRLFTFVLLVHVLGANSGAQVAGMKDFGNRLEGTTAHQNGLSDFTLIGFHRSFVAFPRNTSLHVRFFVPPVLDNQKANVWVEAIELEDSFHYYMRSKDTLKWTNGSWNSFEPWSTRDVIDPLGLEPDNIGVLATYQANGHSPIFLPVDVFTTNAPTGKTSYSLHFVTGQALQSIEITVTDASGKRTTVQGTNLSCNKTANPNCKLYAAGSTQDIEIDLFTLPEGIYHVQIIGHVPKSSRVTSLDIPIYHRP